MNADERGMLGAIACSRLITFITEDAKEMGEKGDRFFGSPLNALYARSNAKEMGEKGDRFSIIPNPQF
jgi:hypothetical protein